MIWKKLGSKLKNENFANQGTNDLMAASAIPMRELVS